MPKQILHILTFVPIQIDELNTTLELEVPVTCAMTNLSVSKKPHADCFTLTGFQKKNWSVFFFAFAWANHVFLLIAFKVHQENNN